MTYRATAARRPCLEGAQLLYPVVLRIAIEDPVSAATASISPKRQASVEARVEPFDLVLTDLSMPHIDGRQVSKR